MAAIEHHCLIYSCDLFILRLRETPGKVQCGVLPPLDAPTAPRSTVRQSATRRIQGFVTCTARRDGVQSSNHQAHVSRVAHGGDESGFLVPRASLQRVAPARNVQPGADLSLHGTFGRLIAYTGL
jgi:hypothetical protein